jgi:predicted metal-binding membrane protein
MNNTAFETVLRRDRLVVAGALGVLTALAWSYVLWLAADMDMGGMDMSESRVIPAGMGIMEPALAPWSVMEFALVFAMCVVMMGMMTPSAAPMLVRRRICDDRSGRQFEAMGDLLLVRNFGGVTTPLLAAETGVEAPSRRALTLIDCSPRGSPE